mgnify:CR=1 FL=1
MRRFAVVMFVCLALIVVSASAGFARLTKAEATPAAMIEDAYRHGELSRDEMILQKAYALYAPWKLREDLRGEMTDKCGSPLSDDIIRALPELPEAVADEIRDLRARPSNTTYVETTHFRIHYDTSGGKKILNWPDTTYRDAIMTAAENVWTQEVDNMGFLAPPPDGGDPDGGGGNDLYDIYVQNLGIGLYGYCAATYYTSAAGYPVNAASSYLVIDNDYAGFVLSPQEAMQVTLAHEFNHACQNAHDVLEETWYKECTSTWIEDQLYDSINDYYNYLPSFLNSLDRSVDYHDDNFRWYGSCVWNFFLAQQLGSSVVVDNWEQLETGSGDVLHNIDVVLSTSYGTTIEDEYAQFAIWCYFTGSRDDGTHFEEGGSWTTTPIMRTHNYYPTVFSGPVVGEEPDRYGCNYILFNNIGSPENGLHVSYDGPQPMTVGNFAFLNRKTSGGQQGEYGEIELNGFGVGELTVDGWDGLANVALVVANTDDSANDMDYDYSADEVDTGIGDATYSFGLKQASPNPFAGETSIAYSVPTDGGYVEIGIFDVTGREVRRLMSERMPAGGGQAVWDGLDNAGRRVSSGVYFARLDIDGLTASGKLIMLK